MKILGLSKKFRSSDDITGVLKQLSSLSQASIVREAKNADVILENCGKFCMAATAGQQYQRISTVLKFVHKANADDTWLLSSSRKILPSLNTIYLHILASSDPSKKASPGRLNVAISSKVQEDKEALRALCCIFELCVDFCDVGTEATQSCLEIFLKSSAAVLFGSNFQRETETLNATEYAMDELARHSSFALSNILLTYPSIVPAADSLLGKRTPALLNFLFSSPEISIQRSLILIIRVLYDHSCKNVASPRNLKSRIENGLSATRFGNGAGLELFKSFDINTEDVGDESESVVANLFKDTDIGSRCFKSDNCTVRMKGKVNGTLKKGGSQKASVDWNKNVIVVHARNQSSAYFPIYTIVRMKWLSGYKEVRLTQRTESELKHTEIVIQFKAGCNRGFLGRAIEQRIQRLMNLVAEDVLYPLQERKTSSVVIHTPRSEETDSGEDEEDDVNDLDAKNSAEQESESQSDKDVDDDQRMCPEADVEADRLGSAPVLEPGDHSSSDSDDGGQTVFSKIEADGILLLDKKESESSDETMKKALRTPIDRDDEPPTTPQSPPVQGKTREVETPKVVSVSSEESNEKVVMDKKNSDAGADPKQGSPDRSPESGKPQSDSSENTDPQDVSSGQDTPSAESDPSWKDDEASDKSHQVEVDDAEMQDVNHAEKENSHPCKPQEPTADVHTHAAPPRSIMKAKLAVNSEGETSESITASDHSEASELSRSILCQNDEGMRTKLLSIVREVMKVRNKRSAKQARQVKGELEQLHAQRAAEDRGLLSKFTGIVKTHAAVQKRKIAHYKLRKTKLLGDARERVHRLKCRLQECQKKLKALRSSSSKDVGQAKTQMKSVREDLKRNLDACVVQSQNRRNSRAKNDSLFEGLAKLLQGG